MSLDVFMLGVFIWGVIAIVVGGGPNLKGRSRGSDMRKPMRKFKLLRRVFLGDRCAFGHDPMRSPSIHNEDGVEGFVQFCRLCKKPIFHPME